jgi:hypothetical protein
MDINKENNELVYFLAENKILHKVRQKRNSDGYFETEFYLPLNLEIEDSKTKLGVKIKEGVNGKKYICLQFLLYKDGYGIISKIFNGTLIKRDRILLIDEIFDCINAILKNKNKTKKLLDIVEFKPIISCTYFLDTEFSSSTKPLEYFTQIWLTRQCRRNPQAFEENVKSIEDLKKTYVANNFFENERELIDLIKNEKDWQEHLELMYEK